MDIEILLSLKSLQPYAMVYYKDRFYKIRYIVKKREFKNMFLNLRSEGKIIVSEKMGDTKDVIIISRRKLKKRKFAKVYRILKRRLSDDNYSIWLPNYGTNCTDFVVRLCYPNFYFCNMTSFLIIYFILLVVGEKCFTKIRKQIVAQNYFKS